MEKPEWQPAGFYNVNMMNFRAAERLEAAGWVPVQGDPARAVMWRRPLAERFAAWMVRKWVTSRWNR